MNEDHFSILIESDHQDILQSKKKPWGDHYVLFAMFVVVQSLSHVQLFAMPWTAACQASLFFTISWSLLKHMSIELVMPSNHLILCRPLLLLPSIFPCIRVFFNESALKSLPQHHNLKASVLWHSVFFMVQLSYPYMTTGKTIALTKWDLCYVEDVEMTSVLLFTCIYIKKLGNIHKDSGEGNGTPLQYSCLENSMDGGAW